MTGLPWDASYHDGPAPWDIGRPQPAIVRLASQGGFAGAVLDAGCGTGENALHVASLGLPVLGVDVAETALAMARKKAEERGIEIELAAADALHLERLGRSFETVLDCGLFHTFDADERPRYAASLASVTEHDGTLYVLCFSDGGPDTGPHPIRQEELRAAFHPGNGWKVAAIEPDRIQTRFHDDGAPAWFATIKRIRTADEERFRRIQQILDVVQSSLGIGLRPPRRYEGDPADLLQEGRTDFAPAVAITLYFDGPLERFRDGVVACWKEFVSEWGSGLRWYADEKLGRWRPCTAKLLRRPIDQMAKRKPMPFNAWYATSAETYESASPVTFSAIVRGKAGGDLSFVRATFPAARVAGDAAAAAFLETTKRWCERIPIRHGYAGLTVNEASERGGRQMNSGMLPQIAERFPGVEIDDCEGTILVARDRIKGINWLTLLDDELVQRLGGLPALRSRLSDSTALHPAGDGAVIVQAGRVPTRGDTESGDDLSLYREVARVLRPISLESHPNLGTVEFGSFGTEGTKRWLRRFD